MINSEEQVTLALTSRPFGECAMGRFTDLKQYGTKVTKFNQSKVLKDMHERGEVGTLVYKWSKSGICAALASNWLKKASRYKDGANDKLMQKALSVQYIYMKTNPTGNPLDDVGVASADGVVIPRLPKESSLDKWISAWNRNDTRANSAVYISFKCSGAVSGSHAVAARRTKGVLHFYDSNCGWYTVATGSEDAFFQTYAAAYAQQGIEISNVEMIAVK